MTNLEDAAAKLRAAAADVVFLEKELSAVEGSLAEARERLFSARHRHNMAELNLCRVARGEEPVE